MEKTYITRIKGKYHAFGGDKERNSVCSIGRDNPKVNGHISRWEAPWTEDGIMFVSCASSSKDTAIRKAQRWGEYCGEV